MSRSESFFHPLVRSCQEHVINNKTLIKTAAGDTSIKNLLVWDAYPTIFCVLNQQPLAGMRRPKPTATGRSEASSTNGHWQVVRRPPPEKLKTKPITPVTDEQKLQLNVQVNNGTTRLT
ncbi:hypothetical protein LSAT2_013564, partial [Lamellibrachia satsuma]